MMNRRIDCRLFAAAALVAVAVAARAQTPGVSATQILIGQSAPLTGSNAELGNDILNGALAYFRKVNEAGGLHGRKLEIVALDDANQVARAEANTVKLVEETRVFALFGYASATLSRPALPIVEKHGVPFLAPFTGADPMRVFNRHVYNMRASYADELEKIVEHFVPLGVKRFSIVYYDDVVGRENFTAVQRALKKRALEPVSTTALKDRANPDLDAAVKAIAQGAPDVVILTTLYKASADMVKRARAAGVYAQFASTSFPGASPLAKELGRDGAGVIVATVVPPPTKRSLRIVQEYQAAIERETGRKDYSFTSFEAYIGAQVAVEAMRRAGPRLTRAAFMRELDALRDFDTGGYVVGFSPSNHNGSSFVELTVIGKDLKFGY
jgi:ABC-type branched-subunit amino acid transport system substrate-binding protein